MRSHLLAGTAARHPSPFAILELIIASGRMPRGVIGRVRSETDPRALLVQLTAGVDEFKKKHADDLKGIHATLDRVMLADTHRRLGGPGGMDVPEDPDYTRTFASWMRRGQGEQELADANASGDRARVRAAMTSGSNGDGGYLAPIEWDRRISKAMRSESPLRQLATVITTTVGGYSTVWNGGGWGSGWVGETAVRPATSTPNLSQITFRSGELYANPAVSQQLLEDAAFDLEGWLATELGDEFAKQEAIAFVSGNGANKPIGFMTYLGSGTSLHPGGEPGFSVSGNATQLTGDGLMDVVFGLAAPYRTNGTWLMSSLAAAKIRKMKDAQGNYLWQPSYILGQPATLLGYPVAIDENMPDAAAGTFPVAFGDWRRFYVINDRLGISTLRDPYTNKPYVQFYTRKRVGGGVQDPNAVRFMKIAAT